MGGAGLLFAASARADGPPAGRVGVFPEVPAYHRTFPAPVVWVGPAARPTARRTAGGWS